MLRHILFAMMLFVDLVCVQSISNAALPWWMSSQNYGSHWKYTGTGNYRVVFYDNPGAQYSCKNADGTDKFPITIEGVQYTRTGFIDAIIKPAMQKYNNKIIGITFTYVGTGSTLQSGYDEARAAFSESIVHVFWNWNYGGLAAPRNTKFSIQMGAFNNNSNIGKNKMIANATHEMTHCLGFSHKGLGNPGYDCCHPFIAGISSSPTGEPTEDTITGIDVVYGILKDENGNNSLIIRGATNVSYSDGYAEAYLVNWNTKKIYYQMPVDSTGKFVFHIRNRNQLGSFKVMTCTSEINKYYGTDIIGYSLSPVYPIPPQGNDLLDVGLQTIIDTAYSNENLQLKTGIKMIYP